MKTKKNKYIWLSTVLSSTVIFPILPFITSCSSTKKSFSLSNSDENEIANIINDNIGVNLNDQSDILNTEQSLLGQLNNLFPDKKIFQDVKINLVKPNIDSNNESYDATLEITINPEYKIILGNDSNFEVQGNKIIFKNKIETGVNYYDNKDFDFEKQEGLTSVGSSNITLVKTLKRPSTSQTYQTKLMRDYGESHGFVYPGYDHNYESNNCQNSIFTNKNNPSDFIDGMDLVFKERVEDGSERKYSDAGWISEQIQKGEFKKHPAADKFFENDISNIDAVEVNYDISSSVVGAYALGLYAPPGEVITIEFDEETFKKIEKSNWRGSIIINDNFWDNRKKGDSGQISNRYPFVQSNWRLDSSTKTLKFGSPFGGAITFWMDSKLYDDSSIGFYNSISNIKFKIKGAIPCMYYRDGVTTKDEWEKQKELVQQNKLAPIIQGIGPFLSFSIPFTGLNKISNLSVNDLKYPDANFRKWNEFLYLSNYYAGRDLDNNLQRLDMQFCDDIWGGASAWGGGMRFYCPVHWGGIAFFAGKPIETFNPSSSWGLFHEINHNFSQDSALFKQRTHGETNQVTAFNLSVISDGGRGRSELNYSGDPGNTNDGLAWARLNNPYVLIYDTVQRKKNNQGIDEYPIYSLLLFMFGSKRYSDYLRWDVRNHPNHVDGWTGFEEIKTLSNHFKLNLWPAFFDYGQYWHDTWPTTEQEITPQQREVINELEDKYPAVDFVGNHYACGNYIYNYQTKNFEYGGDITTPWEIEAGKPVTLNLDKFIISTNQNFNWTQVKFEPTTINGGKLELIGEKKLKYTPPQDPSIIDEFDISIIPGTWEGKSENYVPTYKFKIKMRQVVNEPILTLYENLENNKIEENFQKILNKEIGVYYTQPLAIYNTTKFNDKKAKQAIKIDFNFVAPKDSAYSFKAKWDDAARIFFDGELVFSQDKWTDTFHELQTKEMKKGDVLHIEAYVINIGGGGDVDFQVYDEDNNFIDWKEHALIPNYKDVVDQDLNTLEVLSANKYQYKTRTIDKNVFNSDITSNINLSDFDIPYYDPNKYVLSSKYGDNVKWLNDMGTSYFELWNNDHASGQAASSFDVTFNEPTLVKSLFFGHRTNNHRNARATHIKVTGYDNDNKENGVVLYDGEYGKQFNDRSSDYSILNLNKGMVVKKICVEAYNTQQNGLIWQWFRPASDFCRKIQSNLSISDQVFEFSSGWNFRKNDNENYSALNDSYVVSRKQGETVKINLKNKNGFALIGQANQTPTSINIYVNNKKVNVEPIVIQANERIDNHCLYKYFVDNQQDLTIEIEHLDDKPFFLNYIMTF